MRFAVYEKDGRRGLAVEHGGRLNGLFVDEAGYPGDLESLIANGADLVAVGRALAAGNVDRSRLCASVAAAIPPRQNRLHWP